MGGLWLYVLPTTVHEIQDGFDVGWVQHVSTILRLHLNKRSMSITHDWSMVLLYMVCHGSHQYTPFMLAYIPAPWILWVIVCPQWLSYAYSKGAGKKTIAAILGLWSKIIRWASACLRRDFHRHRCVVKNRVYLFDILKRRLWRFLKKLPELHWTDSGCPWNDACEGELDLVTLETESKSLEIGSPVKSKLESISSGKWPMSPVTESRNLWREQFFDQAESLNRLTDSPGLRTSQDWPPAGLPLSERLATEREVLGSEGDAAAIEVAREMISGWWCKSHIYIYVYIYIYTMYNCICIY